MEFKLVKVIFKNIKVKDKQGHEFTATGFYLEKEGLAPIHIVPKDKEDYKILEFCCEKKFSDIQPKLKDNSGDLLK